jgi:DNA-binding transcriptional ArsR family regulator
MVERHLVERRDGGATARSATVIERPERLAAATHPLAWRILTELQRRPDFASALARRLGIHEQKVYYHVNRLRKAGLLRTVREERRHGAVSRILAPTAEAFALVLPGTGRSVVRGEAPPSGPWQALFAGFHRRGVFDGYLVVGAPTAHGPFLTAARDAPYAAHLAFFLGRHFAPPRGISVRLDTEAKAEGLEGNANLLVVGGPVANIVSLDLNPHLALRYEWEEVWRLESHATGRTYAGDAFGLLARVPSPWAKDRWIVTLSGVHVAGTLAAIFGLTEATEEVLAECEPETPFYRVVEGLDRDGDGRIDAVRVVE